MAQVGVVDESNDRCAERVAITDRHEDSRFTVAHRVDRAGQADDGVDALGLGVDLLGQATPAPDVNGIHVAAIGADDVEERLQAGGDGLLLEIGIEDDHDLVITHGQPTSFGLNGHGLSVAGGCDARLRRTGSPPRLPAPRPSA